MKLTDFCSILDWRKKTLENLYFIGSPDFMQLVLQDILRF